MELALLRRHNFSALCAKRNIEPRDLTANPLLHGSGPYWSAMTKGKKSFGEDKAREIEVGLGLPRYWLDEDHEESEIASAADLVTPTGPAKESRSEEAMSEKEVSALLSLLDEPERAEWMAELRRRVAAKLTKQDKGYRGPNAGAGM